MFRLVSTSFIALLWATIASGQEIKIETPSDWRGEKIAIPAPFAPDMKLKGVEEIRFAPGMFKKDEDDFFSYVFVIQVVENQTLSGSVLESELLAYYRGLCKAVMGEDAKDVDFDQFKIKLELVKGDARGNSETKKISYSAKLNWIEPFVTKKAQMLNLEIDVWKDATSNRPMMFAAVSPSKSDSKIWKQLRSIRDQVVSDSIEK